MSDNKNINRPNPNKDRLEENSMTAPKPKLPQKPKK